MHSQKTSAVAAGRVAANSNTWNRWDNLPKGHRLYSSPEWVRWYHGMGKPDTWRFVEDDDWELRPEMPTRYYVLGLDKEPTEENPRAWRYMSLTRRFERFCDIILAARHQGTHYPRRKGAIIQIGEHGPTPEWRERAQAFWAKLPKNDSDIFDRPARTESPKHGQMAERLAPLLQWVRLGKPLALDATNWLQPDNDGYFDGDEPAPKPATRRERRIRPGSSDAELKAFIGKARAGKLRFSNGRQHESCYVMKGGKAVKGSIEMPRGAILYQEDRFTELKGEEPDPSQIERRWSYWTGLFGSARTFRSGEYRKQDLEPVRHIKAGRMRRKVKLTKAEQLELLAGPLPTITYFKSGLPCAHEDIGGSFLGGWISSTKGKAGVERWEDVSDDLARQAEFERWCAELPQEQQKALNLASTASNFREIGEAFVFQGKTAERQGKKLVLAANDNLAAFVAA